MSKLTRRQKLRNLKRMLCYDPTRWIISSHVGSLFKLWLFTYWIFTIVTRLASPLRLILVARSGWGLRFRLAQIREQWHITRVRAVHTSNYLPNRIPHGSCCDEESGNVFCLCLDLRKMSKLTRRQKLRNLKRMLCYDPTRWIISSHVGSLFKLWLFTYWIFTIVTWLASPLRLILVARSGWGLRFRLAHTREQWHIFRVRVVTRQIISLIASHMERAVMNNQPMFSAFASVCTNVQTHKATKIAKPEAHVSLQPNLLNYRTTCGIVVQILAVRILNFYNRNN